MDFTIPKEITDLLVRIDEFIDREIMPLQHQDDNDRFFDHRREWARTDFEGGGLPRKDWEALLREMRIRADKAGFLRLALPEEYGGKNIGNLAMAIIREHLAAKGLGAARRGHRVHERSLQFIRDARVVQVAKKRFIDVGRDTSLH